MTGCTLSHKIEDHRHFANGQLCQFYFFLEDIMAIEISRRKPLLVNFELDQSGSMQDGLHGMPGVTKATFVADSVIGFFLLPIYRIRRLFFGINAVAVLFGYFFRHHITLLYLLIPRKTFVFFTLKRVYFFKNFIFVHSSSSGDLISGVRKPKPRFTDCN